MKKVYFVFSLLLILFLLSACAESFSASPTPTFMPTLTSAPTVTALPTITATLPPPTVTPTPLPLSVEYNPRFLSALPSSEDICLPDKTTNDIGIYIYDLNKGQELVSVNADVPFQFASAFKGPALMYFLTQCKQYWDTENPAWDEYFTNLETARNIPYYTSPEYKALLAEHFSDPRNWDNVESFFESNRVEQGGAASVIDKRYFILSKVYAMAARSNNIATGEVLQFVFDRCQPPAEAQVPPAPACYQPNAISAFNRWFDNFSGMQYQEDEARRGLFKWDTVIEKDAMGNPYEAKMPTYGLEDACVTQTARLNCSASSGASVWTARDFFKFYDALYRLKDERARNIGLGLLSVDNPGPARGNLKNLARRMGAVSLSKNGHAHFIHGSINTDAGIFYYENTAFMIAVLGYDAQVSLSLLYGEYAPEGEPLTEGSLLRDFLVEYVGKSQ